MLLLQEDTFTVEAVSLGHVKRVIVGHDGTGAGQYIEHIHVQPLKTALVG